MTPITIAFPTHPTLNPSGQFNVLQKNGDRWALLDTTTKQSVELFDDSLILALQAVVQPLMS